MTSRSVAVLLAVLHLLLVTDRGLGPRSAGADEVDMEPAARAHFQEGLDAYGEKDYERAIAGFEAGYAIDPQRAFLYAWAQAERLSGDCDAAIPLYRKFLDTRKPGTDLPDVEKRIAQCEKIIAARPQKVVRKRPWYRDTLGNVLTGAGLVAVGFGASMFVFSSRAADDADGAASYPEYEDRIRTALRQRTFAIVGLGVGAGLVVTGLLRYGLHDRTIHEPLHVAAVGVTLGDGRAAVTVGWTF